MITIKIDNKVNYEFVEDNSGGLFLFVLDDEGNVIDGIENLEYCEDEWINVKDGLAENAKDEVEMWEGHIDNPQELYDSIFSHEFGWSIVCQNGTLFIDQMGRAAQDYFGVYHID